MFKTSSSQPSLFTHREMAALYTSERRPHHARAKSFNYLRWWCSPTHDKQRYETIVRQKFKCGHCGYLLNPKWFDLHHTGYDNLNYEEASDLVAVHRRCHRILEDELRQWAQQPNSCGCNQRAA